MKKILSLILVTLLLIATLALSACGQQATPVNMVRWDVANGETLVYNVRLVNSIASASTTSVTDADDTLITNADFDQVAPLAANGTYTTKVSAVDEDLFQIENTLDLYETYSLANISEETIAELNRLGMVAEITDSTITIQTTINSVVTARNHDGVKPTQSTKTVKGVYIGKGRQAVNDYTVTCTYTDETKDSYCKIDFVSRTSSATSYSENVKLTSTSYFDNEMLFFFVRSYDNDDLAAGATAYVMDPLINKNLVKLTMQSTSADVTLYGEPLDLSLATKANKVVISTGSGVNLISVNYPEEEIFINKTPRATNKTVKIQQGYLVYTLSVEDLAAIGIK